MAKTKERIEYQAAWDKEHTRVVRMKLNLNTDADILARLSAAESVQGYIKQAIRHEIERESAQAAERE